MSFVNCQLIFILSGINDSKKDICKLKKTITKIKPNRVQINTLDRPGTMSDIKPVSKEEIKKIIQYLNMDNIEMIAKFKKQKTKKAVNKNIKKRILQTLKRRPCTIKGLQTAFKTNKKSIKKKIDILKKENVIDYKKKEKFYFIK